MEKKVDWVFMENNYLFAGFILQRRKCEKGRERGRASEGWSCEREIICCFTMCLKNWGRHSVVETERWEEGDGDWEAYVETEKWEKWVEDREAYVEKKKS